MTGVSPLLNVWLSTHKVDSVFGQQNMQQTICMRNAWHSHKSCRHMSGRKGCILRNIFELKSHMAQCGRDLLHGVIGMFRCRKAAAGIIACVTRSSALNTCAELLFLQVYQTSGVSCVPRAMLASFQNVFGAGLKQINDP